MTAYRERKRLADPEHGTTTSDAATDQPVAIARIPGDLSYAHCVHGWFPLWFPGSSRQDQHTL
jgi:hypothetical protein